MIIAQITDTHIVPKGQAWNSLPQTQVENRLKLIVDNLNILNPKPDVVLLTGDATDEGEAEAYSHLKEILEPLSIPLYIIPGNHDNREEMRAAFQHKSYMPEESFIQYVIDDYPVRLIALDTLVPGETWGLICRERVDWLEHTLQKNREKPTLIFMHHPLIKAEHKVMDYVKCFTPDGFEDLLRSFPNIVGIVAGHNHRPSMALFGGTLCFVAPSVAPQFHLFEKEEGSHWSAIDLAHPSFTLHKWTGGFRLLSEVFQMVKPEERFAKKKIEIDKAEAHPSLKYTAGR